MEQNTKELDNIMMKNLINELPGGVAIYKLGDRMECQYFSDGFASMSGRSREEVEQILNDEKLMDLVIPIEYYADFISKLKANYTIGKPLSFTYRFIKKTGEMGWLHISAIKIREDDGCPVYYCIYTNPTDETALYRNIVEDSAIGVFIAERKTRIVLYANEVLCRLGGFEADKVAGMKLEDALEKYDKQSLLSESEVASLKFDEYSEFHITRKGLYLAIKAKALMWNDVDSYVLYITDETSEHNSQIQLEQTLLKEQTLMGAIPGGTAIYRIKKDGRPVMEYASNGICSMFDCSKEDFLGCYDMRKYVYVEDVPMSMRSVQKSIEENRPISVTYRGIKKNGEIFLTHLDAKVMKNEELAADDLAVLYAVHTRISDESKIAMQEQKYYRKILNMTGTAYFEWDCINGFYASEDYKEYAMSEGGFDAIKGSALGIESIYPEDLPVLQHYIRSSKVKNNSEPVIVRLKMKDGHYQWTEILSYSECDKDGKYVKLIGVLRDVDKEWIARNKKLQAALDYAQRANQAKTEFISRATHDMRTSLNGIFGLTAFLRDSVTDEQAVNDINQLEMSGKCLLDLINDTLDMSRIENGKLELYPVVCEGKNIFNNIIKIVKSSIEEKNQELVFTVDGLENCILYCDANRTEQIIMNIIGNAVKFTDAGGKIECKIEQVGETESTITEKIIIRDNGIGMSKEYLPSIFDAFSQVQDIKTSTKQGTGLGMTITKQLLDLMGGTIEVESEIGKGSCFTVVIPFQKATDNQIEIWKSSISEEADNSMLKGKNILICEDHPLNREIAVRLLQNKEMNVECAENGAIGVKMFEDSALNHYDAILMDIRMPVMDGLDAARAIRDMDREDAGNIPIIAMTGNSFDEDVARTLDAGMNVHLSKPVNPVKLFDTLCRQISNAEHYHKTKVLVVDDVLMNREIIHAAITPEFDLIEASDGIEALKVLENDNEIAAVITDMMMLKMDGFELINNIRENHKYDHIAILANTQYEEMTKDDEIIQMGANDIMYKPNTPDDINRKLRSALRKVK